MSNVLLILLIAVAAGASVYLVWLQRQAGLGPDTSDLTSRIKQLEDALREAELEGARLQGAVLTGVDLDGVRGL